MCLIHAFEQNRINGSGLINAGFLTRCDCFYRLIIFSFVMFFTSSSFILREACLRGYVGMDGISRLIFRYERFIMLIMLAKI